MVVDVANKIIYDIDGTIDLQVWSVWDHKDRGKVFLNPNINPDRVKFIVTGRFESYRKRTLEHLDMLGIHPKILCMNVLNRLDPDYLYRMKAAYLNILEAHVYVDDDPRFKIYMPKYWDGIVIDSTELGRYI